ncbi:hypothetical protein DM860_003653 [Cuscuta australis]|uniref:Uncharacterized protein n=1 Tax=Cuscuta australis TaxID=267555 RepID=A0A328DH58_9ASTE|nr:hypothetical protein DM860_003653 [Cuscuta australis]
MNCLYLSSTTKTLYNNNGYSKMEVEDEEEMRHRKAQFLIYKSMKKVDSLTHQRRRRRRRSSPPPPPSIWLIKLRGFSCCRVKIKIGNRLIVRLRKTIAAAGSGGGLAGYKQVFLHLKTLRRLLRGRGGEGEATTVVNDFVPQHTLQVK